MKVTIKRLFCIAFAVLFCASIHTLVAEPAQTVVRVGWYGSPIFQNGESDTEDKSGYSYDYLQKVADYTFWQYQYVYGTWTDLFNKLQNGEIDLLAGVSKTQERMQKMLFPISAMGDNSYYLYCYVNNKSINGDDLSTFNGKKLGLVTDNNLTSYAERWVTDNHINLEKVYFKDYTDLNAAFRAHQIDLCAYTSRSVWGKDDIEPVAKLGDEPIYLAVNKNRPDLLTTLNASLSTIDAVNPFLLTNLRSKHFGGKLISRALSDKECQWVAQHHEIVVGYLCNYAPYSFQNEDGQPTGLMTDVLNAICQQLRIGSSMTIKYQPFTDSNEMVKALKDNKIEVAFPVLGNYWDLEQEGIDASTPVVSCREMFFFKGSYDHDNIKVIAINTNNVMQMAYCRRNFPNVDFCNCSTIEECLDAVLDGRADGTAVNALRTELVTGNSKYNSLSYVLLGEEEERCFGINNQNSSLLLLLNRGISIIGPSYGMDCSYKYNHKFFQYSTLDFVRDHIFWFAILGLAVALLVIGMLVFELRRRASNYIRINKLNAELKEAKDNADSANHSKTNFLFNMSHDIRTPMNAIIGFADLMEKELDQPAKLKEHIAKLKDSGAYLLSLINNVLEVARIDSGKQTIDEKVVDLQDSSISVVSLLESELKKKNLQYTQTVNVKHRYVMADIMKVREVVMNIMSNAVKYTPEGGSIHMQFDELPADKEGYATFRTAITDTGIGMSKQFIEHIFDSFSREHNSTESKVIGSGLGMSIVKKLVDLMGGKIEVESTQGKGSTFTVTFTHKVADQPDNYIDQQQTQTVIAQKVNFKGRRVLLVEDNDINAEIATAILEDLNLEVDRAADGVICLEMLQNMPDDYYDLVLMDIQMPNMNGYQATRRIRAMRDPELAEIPIYAMTANAFEEDKREAMKAGMNGHLAKPIDMTELLKALNKVLR